MRKLPLVAFIAIGISIVFSSCGRAPSRYPRVYNELGKVMVIEYHRIDDKKGDWVRSPDDFRKDLERFYELGYRLISVKDFFNNSHVSIPAGKKPLIMTFDDGNPTQFRWLIVNGTTVEGRDGFPKVDPNCAVGILDDFSKKHPDFGKSATFFLNSIAFYQGECPTLWKQKLKYLVKTGRELGNHTFDHDDLSKLDYIGIKRVLAMQQAKIEEAIPSYEASSVALPNGILPKKGKWLLQRGDYNGKAYNYKVAFLVGSAPTYPPYHKYFDPALVQRVQASDSELNKWLPLMEKYPNEYFISDGDPNAVSVQEKDLPLLEKTALRSGMKIRICSNEAVVREIKIGSKKNRSRHIKTAGKGVYFTFHSAGIPSRIDGVISNFKKTGFNTLVIDMKDVEGTVGVSLEVPESEKIGARDSTYVKDLKSIVDHLHKEGIIVSARIAVFKDRYLAKHRSDLALRDNGGGIHIENDGVNWVDPFSQEVWDYNIDIAEAAIKCGVDEIQFDYMRFPEKGRPDNISIPKYKAKYDAIEGFLKRVNERLDKYNVSIAIDIFGVMSWLKDRDIEIIGQRVREMAKYVDVVCPMLYPSHFDSGFDGHPDPANDPYTFIKRGCEKTSKLMEGSDAKMVPWIQGFTWRVKDFNEDYVLTQIKAAKDCGIQNYLVWNAGNNYTVTYGALTSPRPVKGEGPGVRVNQ
ncbi:MAG: putative glycoside hydrolase [Candidatus Margulisiibacteriota bacterium]